MPRLPAAETAMRRFVLGATLAAAVAAGGSVPDPEKGWAWCSASAAAQQPDATAQPAVPDDPFADELNPFGTGKAAAKKPAPPKPADAPAEPMAPERRPDADGGAATPPPRAKARPKLPVPFPDAPADEDIVPRRGGTTGRTERSAVPGGRTPRSAAANEDAWIDQSAAEKLLAEAEKLERQGRLEEARDVLRRVVEDDPTIVVGHLALGVVLRRLGDFRGSVDSCTKGIEVAPEEPELYLRRGIAWFHQGLYGIALEDFEEAAGIAYEDPRPELWRGLTLIELDRPLEAINAYASAIRRDRSCELAYLNRGLTYLATNQPGKAEFDFNQAIRQKPKDARGWFNRGVAQARQGMFREAIVSYETALELDADNEAARRNLEAARRFASQSARSPGR